MNNMKRTFFFRLRWFRLCGVGLHLDSICSKMPLRMSMFNISSWLTVSVFSTIPNNKPKNQNNTICLVMGPSWVWWTRLKPKLTGPCLFLKQGLDSYSIYFVWNTTQDNTTQDSDQTDIAACSMRPADPDQAVLVIKRANEHKIISSLSAQGGQLKTISTKLSDLVETVFLGVVISFITLNPVYFRCIQ